MSKILYLECYSGISGDMTVAALLDLGADQKKLKEVLEKLPFEGYRLEMGRRQKCGIDGFSFDVVMENNHGNHSMAKVHDSHSHLGMEAEHDEHSDHDSKKEHTFHEHRNLYDIYKILDSLESEDVKRLARKMFEIVAEAEAKAHRLPIEEVHFHEVGAVDSIVDMVSTAFCICNLDIDEIVVSTLYEGRGHVCCQHGLLPVPVPATLNIVTAYGLDMKITDNEGEMVTPTGAAIAAALKTGGELPEGAVIRAVGIGAGKKDFAKANILRAMLLESSVTNPEIYAPLVADTVWKLETNIDDCSAEALAFTMEKLFAKGAKDVFYTPVYMKKNRPAYLLSVICGEAECKICEEIIFANTTTIGIRRTRMERTKLKREIKTVSTAYGIAGVKVCVGGSGLKFYPEYESVKELCNKTGLDYATIYHEVVECAKKN